MMQQVNLYQPILRKQKKVFSARTLLLGNLIILVGLLAMYGVTQLQTISLQQQLAQATQQRADRQQQLQLLRVQYPLREADPQLPELVENQRDRVRRQQQLLHALRGQQAAQPVRFSSQLIGLARQAESGLWFTTIELEPGQVNLHGLTRQADHLPLLVQKLRTETAFSGLHFEHVILEREEQGRLIAFQMRSRRDMPQGTETR